MKQDTLYAQEIYKCNFFVYRKNFVTTFSNEFYSNTFNDWSVEVYLN